MKTFPTLYKRTKTGAIQFWKIEILVVHQGAQMVIIKTSGQLGTISPITHNETIKNGKQGRTPREQSLSQAQSDWKKKHDEGYKSLEDLGGVQVRMTHDSLEYKHKDTIYPNENVLLEAILPKFNTDASGNVKPMLAKEVNWNKVKFGCFVQPKLDGVRCLMVVNLNPKAEAVVKLLSRSGKEYTTLEHITEAVIDYIVATDANKSFILDGEIYSDELPFQRIVAAVKKERPETALLKFRVYDVVDTQAQRIRNVEAVRLVTHIDSPLITMVESHWATDKASVLELHNRFVAEGYEGAIIRHEMGLYGQGQRSDDLLKVKEFNEGEFEIIGGKTNKLPMNSVYVDSTFVYSANTELEPMKALVDSFTFTCHTGEGKEFDVKPVGSRKQRVEYMNQLKDLVGQRLTVKYFGWTDNKLPRFPIGKGVRDYE